MNIEVAKSYLTRRGESVLIVMKTGYADRGHDYSRPYLGSNGLRYSEEGLVRGYSYRGQTMDDLLLEDTPAVSVNVLFADVFKPAPRPVYVEVPVPVRQTDATHSLVQLAASAALELFRLFRR